MLPDTRAANVSPHSATKGQPSQRLSLAVVCDEEALPFRDASLDLVTSGLSLQFVNDLPGSLVQIAAMQTVMGRSREYRGRGRAGSGDGRAGITGDPRPH